MKKIHFKLIIPVLFVFLLSSDIFSQNNISENKVDTSKNIKKVLRYAEMLYNNSKYSEAISYYEKAISSNPDKMELNYEIAVCYYFTDNYKKAIKYFEKAKELKYDTSSYLDNYLADAYHKDYQFNKSISLYQEIFIKSSENAKKLINRKIEECKNGIELTKDTSLFYIKNLGEIINSEYCDYGLFFVADTSLNVFTSKKSSATGNKINPYDGQYYEDIYFSDLQNDFFPSNVNAGNRINSSYPEVCIGISKSETCLYIYKSENNGDIYEVTFSNSNWQIPVNLNFINTTYQETSISISNDGKYIYFVSDRTGTLGNKDIFMIEKNNELSFLTVVNLGENINSIYNEESVFINQTNDTLYFSSEGHNSMGGYDIFRSTKDISGNWQKAENLGVPFNSPNDDLYFFPKDTASYLTSIRNETYGKSDIYIVLKKYVEKQIEKQIETQIENIVSQIETKINPFSEIVDFVVIQNISFEINKFETNNADETLKTLSEYLKNNTETKIAIYGYTDEQGNQEFNKQLSEKRAEFVLNKLIEFGTNPNQMVADGKGYENQISISKDNKNQVVSDALKFNRRVEFEILQNSDNQQLIVEQIEVPEKYKVEKEITKNAVLNTKYSIFLESMAEQIPLSKFLMPNIYEYKFENNYFYYFGEFDNLIEAEKSLKALIVKYPKAYVFENKF